MIVGTQPRAADSLGKEPGFGSDQTEKKAIDDEKGGVSSAQGLGWSVPLFLRAGVDCRIIGLRCVCYLLLPSLGLRPWSGLDPKISQKPVQLLICAMILFIFYLFIFAF